MNNLISCPNCGQEFAVEEALSLKLESHYKKEYETKLQENQKKINNEKQELEEERKKIILEKENQATLIKEALAKQLEIEKKAIELRAAEEQASELKILKETIEKQRLEQTKLREQEITMLEAQTKLKEEHENLKFELKKEFLAQQQDIENRAKLKAIEEFELEKKQLLKQIDDNKKLAEEMKRRAEQGSMQLQGEVLELALEEILKQAYPFDAILEVPKGRSGADIVQEVFNTHQVSCGKIVYESKRTKNFDNKWIDKLRADQLECKADQAVLVTEVFPKDMDKFAERGGVWICSYQEVKSVSLILREMLIQIQSIKQAQENRGEKMELLYNYLTSNEFSQRIQNLVENYSTMQKQLEDEKKATLLYWEKRYRQMEAMQSNTISLFGSIQGIAGTIVATPANLELPGLE